MALRRYARSDALLLTAAIWFLAKFLRYAFPPLFGTFRGEFGVSNAVLGAAFSALMVAYAATQFPSGALADRLGSVTVIVGGALLAAAGSLAVAVPGPFPALVAAMLLVGVGTGAHKTVAVRLLSRAYPRRKGRAIGVIDTVAVFGGVSAPAAVTLALPDWRGLFLAGGIGAVALAVLFYRQVPRRLPDDRSAEAAAGGVDIRQYADLFSDRRLVAFVAFVVAFAFAYNGAVAFLPLYLTDAVGLQAATANLLYSGLFVVGLVQLLTGDLADRVGTVPVMAGAVVVGTAGLAGLVVTGGGLLPAGVAIVAFGVGGHGYRPARSTYLMDALPADAAGGGLGVVRTVLMASAAVAPAVVGVVADALGFRAAFALLAASMAVSLGLLGVVWLLE